MSDGVFFWVGVYLRMCHLQLQCPRSAVLASARGLWVCMLETTWRKLVNQFVAMRQKSGVRLENCVCGNQGRKVCKYVKVAEAMFQVGVLVERFGRRWLF